MTLKLGNTTIAGSTIQLGQPLNIGQIVQSTLPLTDAGLHLLDGALINGSGIYSAFVDAIADLVTDYPDLFETEANWQSSVSTYGVCGKFVYDSVANTVRLPKVTGKLDGTTDITALGDLVSQYVKLPNITGNFTVGSGYTLFGSSGIFSETMSDRLGGWQGSGNIWGGVATHTYTADASRSSSVYSGNGTDTKIHEQAINVLYYIVIATSTKTDIEVDIDQIATDLNGKADVDLTNLSNGLTNTICTTTPTTLSSASSARPAVVVENYVNGKSWYRVWSDGFKEQGGYATGTPNISLSFLKPFSTTDYTINTTTLTGNGDYIVRTMEIILYTQTVNGATLQSCPSFNGTVFYWEAKGF